MGHLLSLQALELRGGQQSQLFASTLSNVQCISNVSVNFCK